MLIRGLGKHVAKFDGSDHGDDDHGHGGVSVTYERQQQSHSSASKVFASWYHLSSWLYLLENFDYHWNKTSTQTCQHGHGTCIFVPELGHRVALHRHEASRVHSQVVCHSLHQWIA